jgi:ankyrin repeat protein
LLQAGATVDAVDVEGHTSLYAAAQEGHVGVMQVLLEAKADVNLRDDEGRTPLLVAAVWGRVQALQVRQASDWAT